MKGERERQGREGGGSRAWCPTSGQVRMPRGSEGLPTDAPHPVAPVGLSCALYRAEHFGARTARALAFVSLEVSHKHNVGAGPMLPPGLQPSRETNIAEFQLRTTVNMSTSPRRNFSVVRRQIDAALPRYDLDDCDWSLSFAIRYYALPVPVATAARAGV